TISRVRHAHLIRPYRTRRTKVCSPADSDRDVVRRFGFSGPFSILSGSLQLETLLHPAAAHMWNQAGRRLTDPRSVGRRARLVPPHAAHTQRSQRMELSMSKSRNCLGVLLATMLGVSLYAQNAAAAITIVVDANYPTTCQAAAKKT